MNAYETAALIIGGAALAEAAFFLSYAGIMNIAERRYAKTLAREHAKISYARSEDEGDYRE